MKHHKIYTLWIMLFVLTLVTLACLPIQPGFTQTPQGSPTPVSQDPGPTQIHQIPTTPAVTRADMIKATVQIIGLISQNGQLTPLYSGSGTIISSTGMILTNAHIASPASQGHPYQEPEALAIGLVDQEGQPPVISYFAKVMAVDGNMDLAVIQISSTMDGAEVVPGSLDLPFVALGNPGDLYLGDNIAIFGFPDIVSDTITIANGILTGYRFEEGLGEHAWMITDAWPLAGGNSGGLAANDAGFIIGVPTIITFGPANCRYISDTNGDGVVGGDDSCIQLGGDVTSLRPVDLALPMIQAARDGEVYVSPVGVVPPPPPGGESFGAIAWYTGTGLSDCQVQDQVNAFPSGTTAMAAVWSFNGMTDGEPWGVKWSLNSELIYSSQYSWSFGDQGGRFLCFYNSEGMPDGNYHIELYAGPDNRLLTQSDVVVGKESNPGPNPGP